MHVDGGALSGTAQWNIHHTGTGRIIVKVVIILSTTCSSVWKRKQGVTTVILFVIKKYVYIFSYSSFTYHSGFDSQVDCVGSCLDHYTVMIV